MRTVIEMAREAGLFTHKEVQPEIERFAEFVRADERKRTWTQEHWTEYERSIAAQEREAIAKWLEGTMDAPYWAELVRARSNT